ncbi:MAG: ATP-grasp domain-containing protein [Candidatus Krumholzibacteriota bacterium]|nr:ATP-grasp domain-containing protein [Candidatus Krumholzibacteriota bacterium]
MSESRVLVVGATRDYISYIQENLPGRSVFLTDPSEYPSDQPLATPGDFHLIHPLHEREAVLRKVDASLEKSGLTIGGVACFDCESLLLASELAGGYNNFSDKDAIIRCRDKFLSKKAWESRGVDCPKAAMVKSAEEAVSFFFSIGGPIVLKPAILSGSELTFKCLDERGTRDAFDVISQGLERKRPDPAFDRDGLLGDGAVLCEEWIEGPEYSVDFIHSKGKLDIVRVARKHLLPGEPAGTVLAYELPAPDFPLTLSRFSELLRPAIESLRLGRCMGMADFFIRDGRPYFLEITPRPAGDCLPQMIKSSSGLDMISAQIDFAAGGEVKVPEKERWDHLVGLRVHSRSEGRFRSVSVRSDTLPQEIIEVSWLKKPGDSIKLPPEDYGSWLIGHMIFRPLSGIDVGSQVKQVREAVELEIEQEINDAKKRKLSHQPL